MEIKLSKQTVGGKFKNYKKFIGGKLFTLGKDLALAQRTAQALELAWNRIQVKGGTEWTEIEIFKAKAFASDEPIQKPVPVETAEGKMTIDSAIEKYKLSLRKSVEANEIGAGTYQALCDRLDACKSALKITSAWDELTYDDLLTFKSHFTKRPISASTGKPISVQTATNNIQALTRMMRDVRRPPFKWSVPEFFEDALRFKRNTKRNMRTIAERSEVAEDRQHMTADDLKRYWQASPDDRTRLFQGLAYWCAWTQMEIATLRKCEVFTDESGDTFIDKRRSKTGQWGKWFIPAPMAKLLWAELRRTPANADDLAFLGTDGKALVHMEFGKRKTDVIGSYYWANIQGKVEDAHSFKWFRKSSAQRIKEITGNQHIAKAFLAHENEDVADQHYLNRMVTESIEASKKLWAELAPIYT